MEKQRSQHVDALLSSWHAQNVVYCHWKSVDHLDEALGGETDLDILVAVDDAAQAEQGIVAAGFVPMRTAALRSYPGVHDYVAYDAALDRFIHLHLHYQLVLGDRWVKAYRLPVERGVLARRVWLEAQQTWVVAPADELVMYCARMCVKFSDPFADARVGRELAFLRQRMATPSLDALGNDYRPVLLALAAQALAGNLDEARRQAATVRKALRSYLRLPRAGFLLLEKLRFAYRVVVELARRKLNVYSFGRRRLARGGLVVAFVGMDGAGKTSAIARNTRFLARQVDVQSLFLGSGRSGAPWYRRIAFALFGTKAKFKQKGNGTGNAGRTRFPFHYLLWNWRCSMDRIARLHQAHRAKSSGRLVLVDRWPQDSVANSFDGPKLAMLEATAFLARRAKLAEQQSCQLGKEFAPDLLLRFVVSPEVARARKPGELTEAQAQAAKDNLLAITWPAGTAVVDIDADAPAAAVDVAVRQAIWSKLAGAR